MWKPISRKTFLKALVVGTFAAASGKVWFDSSERGPFIPCRILGPSKELGHRLREQSPPMSTLHFSGAKIEKKVVIIGAGIAGLSAAWWLMKNGIDDFVVLELEGHAGGNSASGTNKYGDYPWGAHYVPLANAESRYVRELFQELGIIRSIDAAGLASYDELYLCHDPQERLLKDGSFQEGLIPKRGLQPADKDEIKRFFDIVVKLRQSVGNDKKPVFAIPIDLSSQEDQYTALDRISMAEWMKQNGFVSKPLHWYVNYCCRDDYGSTMENVSAWAGLHYFSGRHGVAANAEPNAVVTWPEGNGFLVNKLKEMIGDRLWTNSLVTGVVEDQHGRPETFIVNTKTNEKQQLNSQFVVMAAPRFVAKHLVAAISDKYKELVYAPWMVANISVKTIPSAPGEMLSWDNVSYYSKSLGYVVASHQKIQTRPSPTVLTYYYPMSEFSPGEARGRLYTADANQWRTLIVDDLEKMHPGIEAQIENIDLWPWAHGMIRPSVGFIWGDVRREMKQPCGNIYFAHSDMSGISNFEEAQFHGVEAASQILQKLAALNELSSLGERST